MFILVASRTSFVLFVLLFLGCQSDIISVWEKYMAPPLPLSITMFDPKTGLPTGAVLYSNATMESLFGGQSIYDSNKKIWYFQTFANNGAYITAFDLSILSQIRVIMNVPVPYEEFSITLDDQSNRLILAGTNPKEEKRAGVKFNVEVGTIDLVSKTYKMLTYLPTNHFFLTISGSASVLDKKTRSLLISMQDPTQSPVDFYINSVNVDTGKVTSYPQHKFIVQSMVNTDSGIFAIFSNVSAAIQSSLSVGSVSPVDGAVSILATWNVPTLSFVVNGVSIFSPTTSTVYTVISNGINPPAAIVTVDVKTGRIIEYHYFPVSGQYTQPMFYQSI